MNKLPTLINEFSNEIVAITIVIEERQLTISYKEDKGTYRVETPDCVEEQSCTFERVLELINY